MLPAAVSLTRAPAPLARPPLTRPAPAPRPRLAARPATRLSTQVSPAGGGLPDSVIQLVNAPGPGDPLPPAIRLTLEQSLDVPLAPIRIHTEARTAEVVESIGARAFTYGIHIFLGPRERPTDLMLMAHEVTHVVQQQGRPVLQLFTSRAGDAFEREANSVATAVRHGARAEVRERTGGPQVQALGLSDILDGLANLAANLPGFTLLTVIIGRNPINLRVVERNFTNILRGFIGLIPGGEILFQVLNRYGVVERIGNWVGEQVNALGMNYDYIRGRFTAFTDSLSWTDLFSPGDVWRRAQNIFSEPITRIRSVISRLVNQAITWLKETFMEPLSSFCREIPGYTLVTVLLGRDPFTNVPVPRTALNVVRAFAEFIPGGTEKVNQLVESRALERAYAWFTQETQARNLTWARVTGTFAQAWNSLRLEDVLHPIDTLQRMITLFRPLMSDLVSFAGAALMQLLEFIYEAAMGAGGARILAIIKRARDTFFIIIRDPVGFLRNLLGAVGQGVRQFMNNILRHLRDGVIAWLTGPVAQAGIQIPEQWDLRGIIWFVLQILGLTWDRIRQKLVRLMGERAVALLEAGFRLIQDIRERGLVQALRDRVTEFFGQLREAALGSIRSFIQQRLVMAGITQLLSLLNPVGAVIQAIIKTYTTIQFFIQRINQILDLVESVVNSIAAIASGAIGQAANFIERTMARTIPIILDFLARFIGLGDVGGHVQRTIRGLQARVDQMLDRAVEWIRTMAQRVVSAVSGPGAASPAEREQRKQAALREVRQAMTRGVRRSELLTLLRRLRERFSLRRAELLRETHVVIENSDPEEVVGSLAFTAAELSAASGRPAQLPGGRTELRVGNYVASVSRNVPTVRGLLRDYVGEQAWPEPHNQTPETADRPEGAHVELTGRIAIATSGVQRGTVTQVAVGHLGNFERAFRAQLVSLGRHYEGGHLIGHQFGGEETYANLVPMLVSLNQQLYAHVETFLADNLPRLHEGEPVHQMPVALTFDIQLTYGNPMQGPVWRLARIIGGRFKEDADARAMFGRTGTNRGWDDVITLPARIPTRLRLRVELAPGATPAAGTAPGAAQLGTTSERELTMSAGSLTATRSDPVIVLEIAAPDPRLSRRRREREAQTPPRWTGTWTFNQPNG